MHHECRKLQTIFCMVSNGVCAGADLIRVVSVHSFHAIYINLSLNVCVPLQNLPYRGITSLYPSQ